DQGLFDETPIAEAAAAHGVTPAQVVLRWHLQIGSLPIPKWANPDRQGSNADVFDFSLTPAEVDAISALERGRMKDRDPLTHEEMWRWHSNDSEIGRPRSAPGCVEVDDAHPVRRRKGHL